MADELNIRLRSLYILVYTHMFMAARDTSKETIARELALLISRLNKNTDMNEHYNAHMLKLVTQAQIAMKWEELGIDFNLFQGTPHYVERTEGEEE